MCTATDKPSSPLANERGQAIAEFVLSAITFLFCILGVLQLALCLNAHALVRYASYNAARAGIVHNGDFEKMQDAARISLLAVFPRHGRADHRRGMTENYLAAVETDQDPGLTFFGEPITEINVLHKDDYVQCTDVVTFDDPTQTEDATLTVQVIHRYELVIPLVNRILFYLYHRFRGGVHYQGQSVNYLTSETHRERSVGQYQDIEYRIPLVSHYTMRLQSDFVPRNCL